MYNLHHEKLWCSQLLLQNGTRACHPCFCLIVLRWVMNVEFEPLYYYLRQQNRYISLMHEIHQAIYHGFEPRKYSFIWTSNRVYEMIEYFCFTDRFHGTTRHMRHYISLVHVGKDLPWTSKSVRHTEVRMEWRAVNGTEHVHKKWFGRPNNQTASTCQVSPVTSCNVIHGPGKPDNRITKDLIGNATQIPHLSPFCTQCLWRRMSWEDDVYTGWYITSAYITSAYIYIAADDIPSTQVNVCKSWCLQRQSSVYSLRVEDWIMLLFGWFFPLPCLQAPPGQVPWRHGKGTKQPNHNMIQSSTLRLYTLDCLMP